MLLEKFRAILFTPLSLLEIIRQSAKLLVSDMLHAFPNWYHLFL